VLIFSLEMARAELMSKSISRETYIINTAQGGDQRNAKTTRGIMTGKKYSLYSTAERQLIEAAINEYSTYSTHIFIFEGVGNIGAAEIRKEIEKHIRITGKKTIVIIDYLQIMSPADARSTDKQNTDKGVLELKRTSRDLDLPIIGISSFNRDNYKEPVNLASFKESGSIEYSSDVLIGLQYLGMDYMEGEGGEKDKKRAGRIRKLLKENEKKGKKGEPQQVQVKILKNRNGSKGEAILDFIPMFNYFSESNATSEQVKQEIRQTELDQLKAAYSNAANENGEALLSDMAKKMGTRAVTIKNKLGKYEEFNIDGNTVTLTET
jgi:replicative DNA helicase